jgi:hypothetical protein
MLMYIIKSCFMRRGLDLYIEKYGQTQYITKQPENQVVDILMQTITRENRLPLL